MVITHFRNSVSLSPPFSSCFYLYLKNPIETGPRHHTNEIQRNTDRWFSKLISRINYMEINIFILVGLFRIFISFVPTKGTNWFHNTNQMKKKILMCVRINFYWICWNDDPIMFGKGNEKWKWRYILFWNVNEIKKKKIVQTFSLVEVDRTPQTCAARLQVPSKSFHSHTRTDEERKILIRNGLLFFSFEDNLDDFQSRPMG
jgi:hypothetical protein